MSEGFDMKALINSMSSEDRAKITTKLLGNQSAISSGWLQDVIIARRKIHERDVGPEFIRKSSEHRVIKSNAALILVALFEGDGV